MHSRGRVATLWFGLALSISAAAAEAPPAVAVHEVRDSYFDTQVIDPYRWMEQPGSAELAGFLKAQNAYTQRVLGRLAQPRGRLLQRITELQRGTASVRFVSRVGERYFFLETPANAKDARLMTRGAGGGEKRVLLEPARFATGAKHASIDFFSPSADGKYVAVVVSHGGGEDWTFRIVETATGTLLPDVVEQIAEPFVRWTADGRSFYYSRLQTLAAGAPESAKLDNIRVYQHIVGGDSAKDRVVFGPGVIAGITLPATQSFPSFEVSHDGRFEIAGVSRGTDDARAFWIRDLKSATPRWRSIADYADKITALTIHDARAWVISQKTSSGQVLAFDAERGTVADAKVVIDDADFVVAAGNGELAAASDALYVGGQRSGQGVIRRVAYADSASAKDLTLPAAGSLIEFTTDEAVPGVSFALQSPTLSPRVYRYDGGAGVIADTGLYVADSADFSAIVSRQVEVESSDGARVPMTITMRKDLALDGTHPLLLTVYGAYGSIVPMWFSAPNLAWYERGGILAHVHARGGGEKGDAWHQAAIKTRKQRTVDDVIAAARWLIAAKYTSPAHLAVAGKSAGGIPAGAAIVQHPELFRAALIRVGVVDLLRFEQGSLGSANTMEYGSVGNEAEFRALHAISPYANVKDGVAYPAVLLETGVNDPRVPSWQLAKMTARLQAATSSGRPVLLRVDYDAGHGLGSDKSQIAALLADEYTFLAWQLGMSGFASD